MTISPITLKTGRAIGKGLPSYIIAEIGSNHDGDLEQAKSLIHKAQEAGADAVKFQSFKAETLINPLSKKDGSWALDEAWDTLKALSVPDSWLPELKNEANKLGIDFLSTPFDIQAIDALIELDIPLIKIASGDLTYHELLAAAAKSEKPVVLSTGHATLAEVEAALNVLWEGGCKDIILLQCTSIYPSNFNQVNLPAMRFMSEGFMVQVGISDHTPGTSVPVGAVALGACVIEKHFTDDKTRKGPDHPFALNPEEFEEMVKNVRQIEEAMQGGRKGPHKDELFQRVMARRALYAKVDIAKGKKLTREDIKIVRHAFKEGIAANHLTDALGKKVLEDIKRDTLITWEML